MLIFTKRISAQCNEMAHLAQIREQKIARGLKNTENRINGPSLDSSSSVSRMVKFASLGAKDLVLSKH